jgi:hypothetical protein
MNWNKITVRQYQEMLPIIENESFTDLDKLVKVICILTGKSEDEIDSWPLEKVNEYKQFFEFDFKKEVKRRVKVKGKYYRVNWQIEKLPAARYIEAKTFTGDGMFKNLHRLMASCVIPQKKILFFYFDKKYNAADHEKYATDLLEAPFPFVYNACVFFCSVLMVSIKDILSYSGKELAKQMKSQDLKILSQSLQSITDGFTPQPLSQIMKESV